MTATDAGIGSPHRRERAEEAIAAATRAIRADSAPLVTVTEMVRRHLPEVLEIEAANYPTPWSERLFLDELGRAGRAYLVAREGPTVIGYAGLLMIADDGHVATVSVAPGREGEGIATRLLVELVRAAIELGAAQLTLEVRAGNQRAQQLYGRFGFGPAGARKAYYADNGEDAIVMWAHDVATPAYAERLAAIEGGFASPTIRHRRGTALAAPTFHPAAGARP